MFPYLTESLILVTKAVQKYRKTFWTSLKKKLKIKNPRTIAYTLHYSSARKKKEDEQWMRKQFMWNESVVNTL